MADIATQSRRTRALAAAKRMFEIESARAQLDLELAQIQAEFDSLVPDEFTAPETKAKAATGLLGVTPIVDEDDQRGDVGDDEEVPMRSVVQDFLLKHTGAHSAAQISAALDANPDSVRSVLSKLLLADRIKRVARGVYAAIPGVTGKD